MPVSRRAPYLVTPFLAIGPCRGAGGPSIGSLARMGFKHVIDLNADPSERALSRLARISYHPIRTDDQFNFDSWFASMREAVGIIDEAHRRGEKVYLHCTYGVGRSPTIAMGYLVSRNWTVERAIAHVKEKARSVWREGNPVVKYEGVLRRYSRLVDGGPSRKKDGP